jgi:biopolymer transport protein ExbB
MESSYGLINLWTQGDNVTRFVALALLAMSLISWSIILLKTLDVLRWHRYAGELPHFWKQPLLEQGAPALATMSDNAFKSLVVAGQEALDHHRSTPTHTLDRLGENPNVTTIDLSDWVTRCLRAQIDTSITQLNSGLSWLASIGSTAPFIGLFGTVWGIYHALINIGSAGQATIDKVAGPVGEALIMTALGLAVAIPAVLGYNALTRSNKNLSSRLNRFAHELHAYLVTGARLQSSYQA